MLSAIAYSSHIVTVCKSAIVLQCLCKGSSGRLCRIVANVADRGSWKSSCDCVPILSLDEG